MSSVTVIILTKNEENNIVNCIESVKPFAERIIVIDSFSNDKTASLSLNHGAEIIEHEFETHARQFKYAVKTSNITTKWILKLDADEWFTQESASEIEKLFNENENTNVNAIMLRFCTIFMGKKIKHGGMYPWRKISAYKNNLGDIEDRNMDEHIYIYEGLTIKMKKDCIHNWYKGLDFLIQKSNWYANKEVVDYFNDQNNENNDNVKRAKTFIKMKLYYRLPCLTRSWLYYIYRYYFRFGFLDGRIGKIYHFLQAYWYRFLIDAKIFEIKRNNKKKLKK